MHSRVHSVWQTQHQWKPHCGRVQIMCIHPPVQTHKNDLLWRAVCFVNERLPLRSVGVRHLGHGLEVTRIVTRLSASHRAFKKNKPSNVLYFIDDQSISYLRSPFCIDYVVSCRRHGSQITFSTRLLTLINVVPLETISTKHKLTEKKH